MISACQKHVVAATGPSPFKVGDNQRPERTLSLIHILRMLEEYMKLYNFQTLCAGNGKDALALYDETVDLIILDINMQGMDGVEVCRRIRKQGNVPIIMLSANAASFDKVEALGAGADDYIVKPFDPVELLARVRAHIGRTERFKASRTMETPIEFDEMCIRDRYSGNRNSISSFFHLNLSPPVTVRPCRNRQSADSSFLCMNYK